MATINQGRLLDLIGKVKVATVIVGLVNLGLVAATYDHDSHSEKYFLAVVCMAFILSTLFVLLILLAVIPITEVWKKVDMIFHGMMALLLLIGTVIQLVGILNHRKWPAGKVAGRSFALIFGVLNVVAYSFISFGIYRAPSIS